MVRVGAEVGVVPLFGSVPPVVFWSKAAVAVTSSQEELLEVSQGLDQLAEVPSPAATPHKAPPQSLAPPS